MLQFDANGLIPAIVQHARSGEVLMLGYMNEEALRRTVEQRRVTFWSRSRRQLWQKGETSGNWLQLVQIRQDCDSDALLILAEPEGPTCHTGARSCFHRDLAGERNDLPPVAAAILAYLADRIHARVAAPPEESYTAKLLHGGVDRIGKKIGEEAAEVIIAAKNHAHAEIIYEMADLFYHSLVLLQDQGVTPDAVWNELTRRFQP
jgi:phosphoribosyl-ATP pyrophosphohydrolase/phosphoribosyl-AMP cyclohydrolase